ncbi:hypothetical protein SEA_SWISSCHEESE_44 [Mycobacterium phage SwissCheese]|nr:hypothetical protein SEA_CORVO_43 [Mycobacterium phage Corvo]AVJ49693.1 hypothetical protein SEA_FORSYTHEAST_42 [Mycobacterium phage Forsytheast]AXH45211.1 hypothetical protein SEA_SWISSCHEESE_44 [Mycobacterium phage SwissCheese]AXH46175.1 hypothetical protein SEA_MOOSE_42 [Mycobacterium phage Moose]
MSKHEYVGFAVGFECLVKRWEQDAVARRLGLRWSTNGVEGRHRLPEVRFSQELPDAAVYWSPNRKAFFRRDDSLPSGWVQRIYPRVATSFRTAE